MDWVGRRNARASSAAVVNESRYLLAPWVHIKNLASATLARGLRRLPGYWLAQYGVTPLLVETFVDPAQYSGTCYRAANWVALGETSGRGRDDRQHRRHGARPNRVFLYPLGPMRGHGCGER
ncbi:MAG TPA: Druantia anti-phage system protein DruA [Candidatus Acidoferrales bacterium]|nr:Druantia anti-phage system protein DruA [Candidatus Acidoferrales bacterium]